MASTHIKQLTIRRFKTLTDVTLDLSDFNVFIGSNNSGKSSIIQGLHFLVSILQSSELVRPWDKVRKSQSSISPDQIIYSPSRDPYALAQGGRLVESKSTEKDIQFLIELDNGEALTTNIRKGKNNNINITIDNVDMAVRLASLSQPFTIFSPGLAGLAKTEPYASDGMLLRSLARGDANIILRNILYRLWKREAEKAAFLDDIKLLFPDFGFSVAFRQPIDEFIEAFVVLSDGGQIPIELAGTGLLQATQILAYIHLYNPNLIVLDEPDSHLHPNNQRLICSLLSEMVVDRGIQVMMTTHSRHVLDATTGRAKIFWIQNGQAREAKPSDSVEVLLDMGALDVKETLRASNPDVLVVTEDAITRPLELLVSANNVAEKKVQVRSYFGVKVIENIQSLIEAVRSVSEAKVIVHRDRDYMSEEEVQEWKLRVREAGGTPFVTRGTDVESYFCLRDHILALNPDIPPLDLEFLIADALDARKATMKEKAINWRVDFEQKRDRKSVNFGRIASGIDALFAKDPAAWVHGKILLAGIRKSAEGKPGGLKINEPSPHLVDEELRKALVAT